MVPPQPLPAWEDIKYITTDLKQVLDNFDEDASPIPAMRVRLARTIAEMRDEKGNDDWRRVESITDPYKAIRDMTLEVRARLRSARARR
nr:hypothetical protein [Candidatus Sigynarchaeota archaeon]